jgi:hypothetical protein
MIATSNRFAKPHSHLPIAELTRSAAVSFPSRPRFDRRVSLQAEYQRRQQRHPVVRAFRAVRADRWFDGAIVRYGQGDYEAGFVFAVFKRAPFNGGRVSVFPLTNTTSEMNSVK